MLTSGDVMGRRRKYFRKGMSPNSLFIGFLILYLIAITEKYLFFILDNFLSVFVIVGLSLAVIKAYTKASRLARLRSSGIIEIDKMSGTQFEERLAVLFKDMHYKVHTTKVTGDFGADLIVEKGSKRTVIQAKRHNKPIGVKAIQEANTAISYWKCHNAMVVTNNYYTKSAVQLAKSCGVELWDRERLIRELAHCNKQKELVPG